MPLGQGENGTFGTPNGIVPKCPTFAIPASTTRIFRMISSVGHVSHSMSHGCEPRNAKNPEIENRTKRTRKCGIQAFVFCPDPGDSTLTNETNETFLGTFRSLKSRQSGHENRTFRCPICKRKCYKCYTISPFSDCNIPGTRVSFATERWLNHVRMRQMRHYL